MFDCLEVVTKPIILFLSHIPSKKLKTNVFSQFIFFPQCIHQQQNMRTFY